MNASKLWQNYNFWVNYTFNVQNIVILFENLNTTIPNIYIYIVYTHTHIQGLGGSSGCEWNTFVRVSLALDFTTFTLHDLTDFYVERAMTALHYNKVSFIFS